MEIRRCEILKVTGLVLYSYVLNFENDRNFMSESLKVCSEKRIKKLFARIKKEKNQLGQAYLFASLQEAESLTKKF